jgi:tetratricopeptide (TPR) repeat protein
MNIILGRVGIILLILHAVSSSGRAATAARAGRQTIVIDPKVAGLVKQASSEVKLDQYDAAIRHFSAALQMKPETTTAAAIYSWRADAYIQKGEFSKAMVDANESIRLNPQYYGGYLERAIAHRRSGNLHKAIDDYDTAIRLNPNFARTYYSRAIAYRLKDNYKQAIRDGDQAIRLDPSDPDFYYNRGADYQAIGNLNKAMQDYNEAIRRAPTRFKNYCGRADVFENMGQLDKAGADYDQVLRLSPRDANGYIFRGYAHFAKGDYKAAAFDFQHAVQLSPKDCDTLDRLARFEATCSEDSLRNGKAALAKSLRACELSNWESSNTLDTLAAAYAEVGDFDRAVKLQIQAISMSGTQGQERKKMQERLELYRQHKPYRKELKLKSH